MHCYCQRYTDDHSTVTHKGVLRVAAHLNQFKGSGDRRNQNLRLHMEANSFPVDNRPQKQWHNRLRLTHFPLSPFRLLFSFFLYSNDECRARVRGEDRTLKGPAATGSNHLIELPGDDLRRLVNDRELFILPLPFFFPFILLLFLFINQRRNRIIQFGYQMRLSHLRISKWKSYESKSELLAPIMNCHSTQVRYLTIESIKVEHRIRVLWFVH